MHIINRCFKRTTLQPTKQQPEEATRGALWKTLFLEIPQNSQENICTRVSLLIKLPALDLAQMFSFEFCEIFKSTFLQNTFGWLLLNTKAAKFAFLWYLSSHVYKRISLRRFSWLKTAMLTIKFWVKVQLNWCQIS